MNMYREIAAAHKVALVPFLLESVALKPELIQADGLHPTAPAQPALLETVWPHLRPMLKKR
jgi:acyl-CoA thioesterase I